MRSEVVELVAEAREAPLLGREGRRRRPGGFSLQGSMHAFMATVLFGMRGLDELGGDAETDPPDGESRQAAERAGGERDPVVGADDLREAVCLEQAPEDRVGGCVRRGGEALAPEQVSAEAIGDREGETGGPTAGPELAFEIGGPDFVGSRHRGLRPSWVAEAAPTAPCGHQAVALQDVAGGAPRRPGVTRIASFENGQELLGAPRRMMAASFEQCSHDLGWGFERTAVRPSGPVVEGARAFGLIALDPLVAGFPADVETLAEFGQTEQLAAVIGNELGSLIHRRRLAPRHGGTS